MGEQELSPLPSLFATANDWAAANRAADALVAVLAAGKAVEAPDNLAREAALAIVRCHGAGAAQAVDGRAVLLIAWALDRMGATAEAAAHCKDTLERCLSRPGVDVGALADEPRAILAMFELALLVILHGRRTGMILWLRLLIVDSPAPSVACLQALARTLTQVGWRVTDPDVATLVGEVADAKMMAAAHALALITLLGFEADDSSTERLATLFDLVALPAIVAACAQGQYDDAIFLERHVYIHWVSRVESEEHYDAIMSRWNAPFGEAGRRLGAALGPVAVPTDLSRPKVAFFVHAASWLAHIESMYWCLAAISRDAEMAARYEPVIYVWSGHSPVMEQKFAEIGVPVVWMEGEWRAANPTERLCELRSRLARDGVAAIVWLCLPLMLPFAFGLRLAPVQIWWSYKFHARVTDDADGMMTGHLDAIPEVEFFGRRWKAIPSAYGAMADAGLRPAAEEMRRRIPAKFSVVLGVMGREAKICDPSYVDTIAKILKDNPQCCFCYTGRRQHPNFIQGFERAGVSEQAIFVGWVDPLLWAHVLDIYLDAWPMSSGFTAVNAMAVGKAYVAMHPSHPEVGFSLIGQAVINPLERGHPKQVVDQLTEIFELGRGDGLLFAARTAEEYRRLAQRLIDDVELRHRSGESCRRMVETVLGDSKRQAAAVVDYLLATIARCAGRGGQ